MLTALQHLIGCLGERRRLPAALQCLALSRPAYDLVQWNALNVRHSKILPRSGLARSVDRHDVRLVQLGQDMLFTEKTRLGTGRQPAAANLYGDMTFERQLLRLIHDAHPSGG